MDRHLKQLLNQIIGNPGLHARWLNTFSYLEYIGFRKIIKSQGAEQLDDETLGHAVEEGRHALLLKKLSVKIGGIKFKTYSSEFLLCGPEAKTYFQSLDQACENHLRTLENKPRLTYLYVTWLVELRALEIYGLYQEALLTLGNPISLGGLLVEEEKHLAAVERSLATEDSNFASRAERLRDVEQKLYHTFLSAVLREVRGPEGLSEVDV